MITMDQKAMMDALVQVKRMSNLLNEVQDLSQQLAEAIDRDDRVSVEMLTGMRREPIDKLMSAEDVLADLASTLPPDDGARLLALLKGAPAQTAEEKALAELVGSNHRRLKQILNLDKRLNQKLTRENSVYQ